MLNDQLVNYQTKIPNTYCCLLSLILTLGKCFFFSFKVVATDGNQIGCQFLKTVASGKCCCRALISHKDFFLLSECKFCDSNVFRSVGSNGICCFNINTDGAVLIGGKCIFVYLHLAYYVIPRDARIQLFSLLIRFLISQLSVSASTKQWSDASSLFYPNVKSEHLTVRNSLDFFFFNIG